jgi:hypothetical protein
LIGPENLHGIKAEVAEILSSWDSILLAVIYIFLADFLGQPLTHSVVVKGKIFAEDSWAVFGTCGQPLFTPAWTGVRL